MMIQLAPIVAADHAADHHEHAQEACLLDEASKGIGPRRYLAGFLDTEAERRPHPGRGLPDIAGQTSTCFSVGCASPCSHAGSWGIRRASASSEKPARSRAHRSSSGRTCTRMTLACYRNCRCAG